MREHFFDADQILRAALCPGVHLLSRIGSLTEHGGVPCCQFRCVVSQIERCPGNIFTGHSEKAAAVVDFDLATFPSSRRERSLLLCVGAGRAVIVSTGNHSPAIAAIRCAWSAKACRAGSSPRRA